MRRTGGQRRRLSGSRYAFFRRGGVRRMRKVRLADPRWIECGLDRVVDALNPDETNPVAGVFGYVLDVLAVARRKHDSGDPGLDRRQHLFLHASHRKHQSARRDFARHACVRGCGALSSITSSNGPVTISLRRPGMLAASATRISPPAGVQARPVATPDTLVRMAISCSKRFGPSMA